MKRSRRKFRLIGLAASLAALAGAAHGSDLHFDLADAPSLMDLKQIGADHWNISGGNIMVSGNVHIPFGPLEIFADRAIVNVENKDVEAIGNILVYRRSSSKMQIRADELAELHRVHRVKSTITSVNTDLFGEQRLNVECEMVLDSVHAQRIVGNLSSGYMSLDDLRGSFANLAFTAKSGERKSDGSLVIREAVVSSCNYLADDNAHYSVSCREATLTPNAATPMDGITRTTTDRGEYAFVGYNCTVDVYGLPLLWLPMFYKPKDESPGLFKFQIGTDSDLGFFVKTSKRFDLTDYPFSSIKLHGDYFSSRGIGYGADLDLLTENSKTYLSAYSIHDNHPYRSVDYYGDRFKIPSDRYGIQASNITHITPRLDFRGNLFYTSDYYFLYDFDRSYFNSNPEPATYGALEYQGDRFSAALYFRPQVNEFYTTVERLPQFRIDIPRQEIFNTNIYYQAEMSMDYLRMRWRRYDRSMRYGETRDELKDYETFRWDLVQFLYYPIRFLGISVTPRAGLRLTEYSSSSDKPISSKQLTEMYVMDNPDNSYKVMSAPSYDNDGGNQFRVAVEFGVEASTKIYSTWQDIRVPFIRLDGLRHVIEPYMNYTFLLDPTVSRDHLMAFDDIDRITEQNFVRLGMFNRLQTRNGNSIRNFITMENYWDYYFNPSDGFENIGDFCTKLSMPLFDGFTLSTAFSVDAGGNNERFRNRIVRRGEEINQPGLNMNWLNYWNVSLTYEPVKDFVFNLSYEYRNCYGTQAAYSMGSTLSSIQSGTLFDNYYLDPAQTIKFGMRLPLTPDRRTFGAFNIAYDFYEGGITDMTFRLIRQFHCVEVALELQIQRDKDDDSDHFYKTSFYGTAYLRNLAAPIQQAQGDFLSGSRQYIFNGN